MKSQGSQKAFLPPKNDFIPTKRVYHARHVRIASIYDRCRADTAHIGQSRPYYGHNFLALTVLYVPYSLDPYKGVLPRASRPDRVHLRPLPTTPAFGTQCKVVAQLT
jgi:hypothetical protein